MYTGITEFKDKVDPEIMDTYLQLGVVRGGLFSYIGEFDNTRIIIETSMNDVDNMNYFHTESVESLLDSDNVRIYFNEICVLWVY